MTNGALMALKCEYLFQMTLIQSRTVIRVFVD